MRVKKKEDRTRFYYVKHFENYLRFKCGKVVSQEIIDAASKHRSIDVLEFELDKWDRLTPALFEENLNFSPFSRHRRIKEVRIRNICGTIDLSPLRKIKSLTATFSDRIYFERIEFSRDKIIEQFDNRIVLPASRDLEKVTVSGALKHDRRSLAQYPKLKELTIEDLEDNDLSWLSESKSIEKLDLQHTLPDHIILPELVSLKELWIGFSLRDKDKSREMRSLKTLDLSPLSVCKELQDIRIYGQRFKEIDLSPLASCKSLKNLLIGSSATSVDVSPLSSIPLESLDLGSNIHSIILPDLRHLRSLGLGYNKFQSIDLSSISRYENLETLGLRGNQFQEIDLSPLLGLSKLRYLDLSNNKLEELDLSPLSGKLSLHRLELNGNNLEKLDLSPLKGIDGLLLFLNHNKHLKEVDVTPLLEEPNSMIYRARGIKLIASKEVKEIFELNASREKRTHMSRKIQWY